MNLFMRNRNFRTTIIFFALASLLSVTVFAQKPASKSKVKKIASTKSQATKSQATKAPTDKSQVDKSSTDKSQAVTKPANDSGLDFDFIDFKGKKRKFSEFRGKFVLIDFWATWCKPCLADIPKLKELYEKYKDSGFEILGMDAETLTGDEEEVEDPEFAKEQDARAKQVVTTRGVTWTQAISASAVPVAKKILSVKALPTKILVDKDGKEIARIGEKDDLKGIVEKLLNEKKQ